MNSATRFHATSFLASRLLPLVLAATVPVVSGQPAHVQLPAAAHGSAAIAALGAHLPAVAKAYGLEAQELATLFQTQPSLGVDPEGALLFACEGLAATKHGRLVEGRERPRKDDETSADGMTASSSVTALAAGSSVDAFKLHSLPGVSRVIHLDFDGHTTTGTSWNSSYAGGSAIVSAPFDLDGDPTTFNDRERGLIQRIWQRVAEDYAPFGVDVTTEDPGLENLRKTSASDTAFGIRAVISPTNWYKSTAGGVAYIGSFSANSDTPCFAFAQQLLNDEKFIAEAVSHEVGHTLGLYHDGVSGVTEYYEGQGDWAPIMGVGYYRNLVQFSKGEYASASNTQDDFAVIAGHVALAGDDHGNTLAAATRLAGSPVATGGTIESRSDVDVFRFDANAGDVTFQLRKPGPDTNLDLNAELLNANGQLIQAGETVGAYDKSLATTLPAGTYFLRIAGAAYGDVRSTGYSNYGSVGNYILTGTFPTSGIKQAPVANVTATTISGVAPLTVTFSGQNSTDADGTIVSYAWNFGNGSVANGVSASTTYPTEGTFLAVLTVVDNDGLAGTAAVTINVTAPTNVAPTASASASVTTGTAPVPVIFSSAGSADPDGVITSYRWDFGDGTSATVASPSKTYTAPGNYTVRLTVTDDRGASASSSVTVAVLGNADLDVDVSQFVLTTATAKSGSTATASIVILDRKGRPVPGATVSVQWSGLISSNVTGKTDTAGRLMLTSQKSKKAGALTATITNVVAPGGAVYDATIYNEPIARTVSLK